MKFPIAEFKTNRDSSKVMIGVCLFCFFYIGLVSLFVFQHFYSIFWGCFSIVFVGTWIGYGLFYFSMTPSLIFYDDHLVYKRIFSTKFDYQDVDYASLETLEFDTYFKMYPKQAKTGISIPSKFFDLQPIIEQTKRLNIPVRD